MNTKLARAFRNPAFIAGVALLLLGSGPLLVFCVLQEFGYFPGNNGLGLGLLFFFTVWPALALVAWGFTVAVRRVDAPAGKGDAA
jgi:hypothetical protein